VREENLRIGVQVTVTERQLLESLKAQAGLPTLSSVVRLLINQSAGIMPPRVVGRTNASRGAVSVEAQHAAAVR
jgi:hypothetical protein